MLSLRNRVLALALAMAGLAATPAHAAEPAVFDAATSQLRLPILHLDGNLKFCDVVIRLASPGQLRLNDSSVGADISFTWAGNVLRIPQLSFGGVVYPAVSLTRPTFSLVSFGEVSNPPPSFNGTAMVAACGNVFVEPAVASDLVPGIVNGIRAALEMDRRVYGPLQATQPDVLVCQSGACADYFAGPRRRNVTLYPNTYAGQYVAPRMTVVLTSPTWTQNPYVLAHEFSHVEVARRIGGGHVPAWFDEGLATYVGGEPICTNVTGKGIDDLRKLDREADWVAYTGPEPVFFKTYCQARAEVAAWIGRRGNAGVVQLLDAVRQGQSFWTVYGAMVTQ